MRKFYKGLTYVVDYFNQDIFGTILVRDGIMLLASKVPSFPEQFYIYQPVLLCYHAF